MNFKHQTLTLLAAVLLSAACRETQTLGPSAPVAGMGAGGAPATPTSAGATLAVFGTNTTVTGMVTFVKGANPGEVTVTVTLNGCETGKLYPVHIHAGTACTDAAAQGDHWGPTRGEGIPSVMCTGTTGTSTFTRPATDPMLAWTIGGDAATNVIGHAFVAHAPDMPMMPARIACGVIAAK